MITETKAAIIKPILFNTDMVKAIVDNRKTCTRRLIKIPQDYISAGETVQIVADRHCTMYLHAKCVNQNNGAVQYIKCPYRVNDILYIRETWTEGMYDYRELPDGEDELFIADFSDEGYIYYEDALRREAGMDDIKWRPSIYMPKEAARIHLRVTDVRMEHLQDMQYKDAVKEGISDLPPIAALDEFADLWNVAIKKSEIERCCWNANPWVWVIEFERYKREDVIKLMA